MSAEEKCEFLKDSIRQLYSKEGRSRVYISRLLQINRKILGQKIREWDLPEAEPKYHLTAKTQKLLDKNKIHIIKELSEGKSVTEIAEELHISRGLITKSFRKADPDIRIALEEKKQRIHEKHVKNVQSITDNSSREYDYPEIPGERWKPILGYTGYEVSDQGRIRKYTKRYKKHYLLKTENNKNNDRVYVRLTDRSGRSHNIQVARLVGYTFVGGHSSEKNTINHRNGVVTDNRAVNLEWTTQSENNKHSYRMLDRKRHYPKRYEFSRIVYKGRYEFKTVAALARFINMSETQTRRYLDEPEKHDLIMIK